MATDDDKDLDETSDDETEGSASDDSDASGDSSEGGDQISDREAREIERENSELAAGGDHDVAPIAGMLGLERWVQFAFIAMGVLIVYVSDELIGLIWGIFAEPDGTIVSGSAALLGIVGAFALYRHSRINELAHEVVSELAKVTWPTRDETYYSTLVVIVTSVIAAVYTGVFDALWSAFTDLIYNV